MTDRMISQSIHTGELSLRFWEKSTYFRGVFICLLFPVAIALNSLKDILLGNPVRTIEGGFLFCLICTFLGILFYFVLRKKLQFSKIQTDLPRKEIDFIIEHLGYELGWHQQFVSDRAIVARSPGGFFSCSQQITILFSDRTVWINSICNPKEWNAGYFSQGKNNRNRNRLLQEIEQASHRLAFNLE